jgi:hypothetical protein
MHMPAIVADDDRHLVAGLNLDGPRETMHHIPPMRFAVAGRRPVLILGLGIQIEPDPL